MDSLSCTLLALLLLLCLCYARILAPPSPDVHPLVLGRQSAFAPTRLDRQSPVFTRTNVASTSKSVLNGITSLPHLLDGLEPHHTEFLRQSLPLDRLYADRIVFEEPSKCAADQSEVSFSQTNILAGIASLLAGFGSHKLTTRDRVVSTIEMDAFGISATLAACHAGTTLSLWQGSDWSQLLTTGGPTVLFTSAAKLEELSSYMQRKCRARWLPSLLLVWRLRNLRMGNLQNGILPALHHSDECHLRFILCKGTPQQGALDALRAILGAHIVVMTSHTLAAGPITITTTGDFQSLPAAQNMCYCGSPAPGIELKLVDATLRGSIWQGVLAARGVSLAGKDSARWHIMNVDAYLYPNGVVQFDGR